MTTETIDKTCTIVIHNVDGWELDAKMAAAVLERIAHYQADVAEHIDIYPQLRDARTGMLEWIMRIKYRTGSFFTIGAIQRSVGGSYEFHS